MKFEKENTRLGFPNHFRFGIEIEARNVNKKKLYQSKESLEILKSVGYKAVRDDSVDAECVSGILKDSDETWGNLEKVCAHIKACPVVNEEVVADEKCGCHVHFDAREFLENPKMMENLLKLWIESEELLYKMCNAENNPMRKEAIDKGIKPEIDLKQPTLKIIKSMVKMPYDCLYNSIGRYLFRQKGYAIPSGQRILNDIKNNKLKVSYKKYGKLQEKLIVDQKINPRRYEGLNLANLGSSKKNTIEFRMANGSVDPEVIKQNVYLYGSLLNTAREMTLNPEYKKEEVGLLRRTDCTEEEKANRFLNLLFEHEEDKNIYKSRWKSVKDAPVFVKNTQRFAKDRFVREDMKQVAEKTPLSKLQDAMMSIEQKVKSKDKGMDIAYGK